MSASVLSLGVMPPKVMHKLTVAVVDYGIGNHGSVRHALHDLGIRCRVGAEPAVLAAADVLLLPGVGAFRPAMTALRDRGLDRYLHEQVRAGRPLVGICLGMQLLARGSHEDGWTEGLGLLSGEVRGFPSLACHTGWNTVTALPGASPLLAASDGEAFYFNHAYYYDGEHAAAQASFAGVRFAAMVGHAQVFGAQFHPEKSQAAGRALLARVLHGAARA